MRKFDRRMPIFIAMQTAQFIAAKANYQMASKDHCFKLLSRFCAAYVIKNFLIVNKDQDPL